MKRYVWLLMVLTFSTSAWGSAVGLLAPSRALLPGLNAQMLTGASSGLALIPSASSYLLAPSYPSASLSLRPSLALQTGAGLVPNTSAASLLVPRNLPGGASGTRVTYSQWSFGGEASHSAEWNSTQTSN